MYFYNHLILSIEDITGTKYSKLSQITKQHEIVQERWEIPILLDNFEEAATTAGLYLNPSYSSSYRYQICNGVVINDRCSDCMFDWDS